MLLLSELSDLQGRLQDDLFPYLEERLGPLAPSYQLLVAIFEMAPVAAFLRPWPCTRGRPPADRAPLVRASIAKAVLEVATTSALIERLQHDKTLRRLCGWHGAGVCRARRRCRARSRSSPPANCPRACTRP